MRRAVLLILSLLLFKSAAAAQSEREILVLTATGPLTPAMLEYLDRGLQLAERQEAEALILTLDTPGGQVELMNRIIQSIRGSGIPVVIYIAPRGAIAGSAGTVITLAGHVAAMAPETAIGAASPVGGQGEELGETIERKTKEILKAEARGLADRRGEAAVALAEATIEEAKAASAEEALQAGLIDFIADDVDDLLGQLDGFTVELETGPRTLSTRSASLVFVEQTFIEQLLGALTNPNIVFLLMAIGVQAILIEISSPGGWVAGFVGVMSLALGAFGLGVLPVNWTGLIFLATAFVLFILDIKAPTHGALTAAGVTSFIAGALILFNSPGTPAFQRVSVPLVIGTGLAISATFLTIVTFAVRAQRRKVETGREALIGLTGITKTELAPTGMVQVAGELWSAKLADRAQAVPAGQDVVVTGVDGLSLEVRTRGG